MSRRGNQENNPQRRQVQAPPQQPPQQLPQQPAPQQTDPQTPPDTPQKSTQSRQSGTQISAYQARLLNKLSLASKAKDVVKKRRKRSVTPSFVNKYEQIKRRTTQQSQLSEVEKLADILSKPKIPDDLPLFYGNGDDVMAWLRAMMAFSEIYGWQDEQWYQAITSHLRDGALNTWCCLPPHQRVNIESVIAVLIDGYAEDERPDKAMDRFESTKQGSDTVQNYYGKLKGKAIDADLNPTTNPNDRNTFIRVFRRGLNKNIRDRIDHKFYVEIADILADAKKQEQKFKNQQSQVVSAISSAQEQEDMITKMAAAVVLALQKSGMTAMYQPQHCTYCGYSNHTEERCYRKHPSLAPKGWSPANRSKN